MELQLTEDCISVILSLTSPWDTCRASGVSPEFRSAADSNEIWDKFLPADIPQIITRSVSPLNYTTKKQLYLLLSDSPILLDDRNLSFALDKRSGKKCFMLGARRLLISWGENLEYWRWLPHSNSRFSEVAVLRFVWWLDIRGRVGTSILSPKTTYETYLVFKLDENAYGLESAKAAIRFVNEREDVPIDEASTVYLDTRGSAYNPDVQNGEVSRMRDDGWLEVKTGEFESGEGDDGEVEVRFMEIHRMKGGIIVQGIEFRPKAMVFVV